MKELYTSPEAKLLCLAPAEQVANNGLVDFDTLLGVDNYYGVSTNEQIDIDVDIPTKK